MEPKQRSPGEPQQERIFAIELVWDEGHDATAVPWGVSWEGRALQVGPTVGWLPAHLITLAAASSFLSSLLELAEAAGIPILGYVSISKLHVPSGHDKPPAMVLTPCIVVGSHEQAREIEALCRQALEVSDVCRMLQDRVRVTPETRVIAS